VDTGGSATPRVRTGDDRMIEVVGVPKRPSAVRGRRGAIEYCNRSTMWGDA